MPCFLQTTVFGSQRAESVLLQTSDGFWKPPLTNFLCSCGAPSEPWFSEILKNKGARKEAQGLRTVRRKRCKISGARKVRARKRKLPRKRQSRQQGSRDFLRHLLLFWGSPAGNRSVSTSECPVPVFFGPEVPNPLSVVQQLVLRSPSFGVPGRAVGVTI